MLVVVLNMPEHSSFQDMLFPMLFISKYAKSYASIMDIGLVALTFQSPRGSNLYDGIIQSLKFQL